MSYKKPRRSRPNQTGRNGVERFVLLHHWMLNSKAWKDLHPNSVKLLIDIWKRNNGYNNGEISYSVREAEDIGLSKDQAKRAFDDLISHGFLKIRRNSAFNVKTREARLWELTALSYKENTPTKEFMRWDNSVKDT